MQEAIYRLRHCVENDDYNTQKELLEEIIADATGKLKNVERCIEQQKQEEDK